MQNPSPDKDLPLRDDTRLLGRLLGDVLREQTGDAGFLRVEAIRQTAIRFRRADQDAAPEVKAELAALLNALPISETLHVVRAFSYFSHLANLAEDVHQNRRRRAHALAGSLPQRGSIADALDRLADQGVGAAALATWFADAQVSPVLTAHPTEVQRKSILDCEREIVRLLQWRDRVLLTPDEVREFESGLRRQVLMLWQTAMIRLSKLSVKDEIDNGLAYYRYTFLGEVPRLYLALEARLDAQFAPSGTAAGFALPPFLRPGSWIGGDRDGNPFVVAATLEYAIAAQAAVAFAHYLGEIHALGGELSLSTRLVQPTGELLRLAASAHDDNPHRADEPYRQALIGIYARLAATARALVGYVPPLAPHGEQPPYATPAELAADLQTIARSLSAHGAAPLAEGRLEPLRRAVDVFGFHLAVLDLRQNADVHETVVAELLAQAGVAADYAALAEDERVALLVRELAGPRLLHSPHLAYSERTASELAIVAVAAGIHRTLRRRRAPALRDLEVPVGVRPARGRDPAEGSRSAAGEDARPRHRAAVRDHRRPPPQRGHHARRVRAAVLSRVARRPRRMAGSDAGLLGQQQGRRLRDRELGALSRRTGTRRRVPSGGRQAAAVPRPRRHRRPRRRPELRGDPRAADRAASPAACA